MAEKGILSKVFAVVSAPLVIVFFLVQSGAFVAVTISAFLGKGENR